MKGLFFLLSVNVHQRKGTVEKILCPCPVITDILFVFGDKISAVSVFSIDSLSGNSDGSGKSDSTEANTESTSSQEDKTTNGAENSLENYRTFASEKMGFSFLYESPHTAYVTDAGAAEIEINGDDSLVGLFVSVGDGYGYHSRS